MRRVLVPAEIRPDAPPAGARVHDLAGSSMGTGWTVRYAARQAVAGLDSAVAAVLAGVDGEMSHWRSDSELGRYNDAAAGTWHAVSPAFLGVLAAGLDVRDASGGAFDPCAGALVDLWGFGPHGRHAEPGFAPPAGAAIDAALTRSRAIELESGARRIRQPGGVRLDLSGIAKGYAVDAVCALLETRGLRHYLVEIGGELRGAGIKPDGQPWWVTLEEGPAGGDTVLALHGLACATSGDYRRYFDYSGKRYAHTLDPRTGRPVANGVRSATVIAADCMHADAWATALTVLGPADGIALADARGLAARLLAGDGAARREFTSAAFRALLD